MLKTNFTPFGRRKQSRLSIQQLYALGLSLFFIGAFLFATLRYMLVFDLQAPLGQNVPLLAEPLLPGVVQAQAAAPSAQQGGLPTPPAPSADPAATAPPSPKPETTLTEDAENGLWSYESAEFSLQIRREAPKEGVVATVALLSWPEGALCPLQSAFAGGSYARNLHYRTSEIAKTEGALFAINGDYYGFRGDGIIVRGGALYREKPARDMLCLFADGSLEILPEQGADVEALLGRGLRDSFSFGPALVVNGALPESFITDVSGANPRTALGQKADGSLVFVVVDGRLQGFSSGLNIRDLAAYMQSLGCVTAYNLDGGMTSCMVFNGQTISRPCGAGNRERPLSDILLVKSPLIQP
ncbi:MAG: phosphodiester glycosidase family protein [Christensenellaceae bacterium]|jgi:hypothetical protein|nr:phosphodiester glycosidase family protein [Christensenellaceae bacterium]